MMKLSQAQTDDHCKRPRGLPVGEGAQTFSRTSELVSSVRPMNVFVAWRMLAHEKGRNTLAVGGIFIAVLMIFLQLGVYNCVPTAGMLTYNGLRFDILLTSSSYVSQVQSYDFPRARLYQALSLPEVKSASPFYLGEASWLSDPGGIRRDIFVMAFRLADRSMIVEDIERQLDVLKQPDTGRHQNPTGVRTQA